MAYFRVGNTASGGGTGTGATITVTYSSDFYGETLTATNGNKTVTVVAPSTGTVDIEVPEGGTWTISATIGGYTYSTSVVVNLAYSTTITTFNATVTVTFPYALGATCTLSDGVTTLTATQSPMAFSVGNTGTWVATITLDGATKTDSAVISTDGQSESLTIEYGTINLTYDNDFKGLSLTCVSGGTTITKTAPNDSNTMAFYPPTTGTWTISGTVGGTPYTVNATISSLSTAVSANLETIPNGSSVTPTDDIQIWLKCAQISGLAYTTLAEVLADTDTLWDLLANSNACDYMARSTTWANDTVADSTAMTYIGKIDYCAEALLADSTWASAIGNSTYFESVLNVKVPTMTSDTTPSGEVIYSSESSSQFAYQAFDKNNSTTWSSSANTYPQHIGYKFDNPTFVSRLDFTRRNLSQFSGNTAQIKIQGSVNGSTDWIDLTEEFTQMECYTSNVVDTILFTKNLGSYRAYRVYYISGSNPSLNATTAELQFYGRTSSYTENYTKIHSAASDTIYYVDNGNNVTLGTTDTNGDLSILTANLPSGNITLYSSVAKNPTDLSADYSKVVRMNKNVTEVYVMPYGALYWWGYKTETLSSSGWVYSNITTSQNAPVYNTNDITLNCNSSSSSASFAGTSNTKHLTKVNAIGYCTSTGSALGRVSVGSTKDAAPQTFATLPLNTIGLASYTATEGDYYIGISTYYVTTQSKFNAIWYE